MPSEKDLTVLVVDDEEPILELVKETLTRFGFEVFTAADAEQGITLFRREDPVLILTDINMPRMTGIELLRVIKKESPTTQVIVFSGVGTTDHVIETLRLGACDYMIKPFNLELLVHTVNRCLERHDLIKERMGRKVMLEQTVHSRTAALTRTLYETVKSLGRLTEMRDPYTAGHQQRVALLAVGVGKHLGLTRRELQVLHIAGLLHDIGKAAVPVELLVKPTELTPPEFQLMRCHPKAGYDILKDIPFAESLGRDVASIVQQHHERLDGSGYPNKLTEVHLLLEAKILSVADAFEAMSSHRPYRPALGIDFARTEIAQQSGQAYMPECVDACLYLMEQSGFNMQVLFDMLQEFKSEIYN